MPDDVEMALEVTKFNSGSLRQIICHGLTLEQCNVTEILVHGFSGNGIADELTPLLFIMRFIAVPHSCFLKYVFSKVMYMPMCTEMVSKELYLITVNYIRPLFIHSFIHSFIQVLNKLHSNIEHIVTQNKII